MIYLILACCLLGIYKGIQACFACIKADALIAAFNMFLIVVLFTTIFTITLYYSSQFNLVIYDK